MWSRAYCAALRLLQSPDLADHHNRLGLVIGFEAFEVVKERAAVDRVSPIPTLVLTPTPISLSCDAASYPSVPDRLTMPTGPRS